MSADELDERLNIDFSRQEREIRDRILLLTAGLPIHEAERIARLAAEDRAVIEAVSTELAA